MKKVINDKTIYFYDENDNEIMYIDHSTDECIWFFQTDSVISIEEDTELYCLLESFMQSTYDFSNDTLKCVKDENNLVWYSDCYYNPDDDWSIASVSVLNIKRDESGFKVWCTKKLDELINRNSKTYGICFSPAGNGKYSRNLSTGLTLQDDFVTHIYQPLLNKNKVLKKEYK